MKRARRAVLLAMTFLPSLAAEAADPVEGRWKFPSSIRILAPDGSCTNADGKRIGTWKCVSEKAPRQYVITMNEKAVDTLVLKEGEERLEGTSRLGKPLIIVRLLESKPEAPVTAELPKATPPTPTKPVATPASPQAGALARSEKKEPAGKAVPVAIPPLPAGPVTFPLAIVGGTTFREVKVEEVKQGNVTFSHQKGKETAPFSDLSLRFLEALAKSEPSLAGDPVYKKEIARFVPTVTLKDGTVYTAVKMVSHEGNDLVLRWTKGNVKCTAEQIAASDLARLFATEPPKQKAPLTGGYQENTSAIPTGALPIEYVRFLHRLGDPWTRNPALVGECPQLLKLEEWSRGLGTFEPGGHARFKDTVKKFQEGVAEIFQQDREKQAYFAQLDRNLDDLTTRQKNGELREFSIRNDDATGRQRKVMTSDGTSTVVGATVMNSLVQGLAAVGESMMGRTEDRAEGKRLEVLHEITMHLSDFYPASPEKKGLVAVRLQRDRIEVTNISGRALTHLTFGIEFIHFTTAPHIYNLRTIYVAKLENGATAYLHPRLNRNYIEPKTKSESRPDIATYSEDNNDAWLWTSGGMLSARVNAWALEAHESATVTFPKQALEVGQYELRNACKALGAGSPVEKDWALASAQRVLANVPKESPVAAEARALLANPGAAAERGRAMVNQLYQRLLGEYEGRYELLPKQEEFREPEIVSRIKKLNATGTFTFRVTNITPDRFMEAEIYPPDHPEQKRLFRGKMPPLENRGNMMKLAPVENAKPPGSDQEHFARCVRWMTFRMGGPHFAGRSDCRASDDSLVAFSLFVDQRNAPVGKSSKP